MLGAAIANRGEKKDPKTNFNEHPMNNDTNGLTLPCDPTGDRGSGAAYAKWTTDHEEGRQHFHGKYALGYKPNKN